MHASTFLILLLLFFFVFFKQKTAYEWRMSDWSSDVCSSDLRATVAAVRSRAHRSAGGSAARRGNPQPAGWRRGSGRGRPREPPASSDGDPGPAGGRPPAGIPCRGGWVRKTPPR